MYVPRSILRCITMQSKAPVESTMTAVEGFYLSAFGIPELLCRPCVDCGLFTGAATATIAWRSPELLMKGGQKDSAHLSATPVITNMMRVTSVVDFNGSLPLHMAALTMTTLPQTSARGRCRCRINARPRALHEQEHETCCAPGPAICE